MALPLVAGPASAGSGDLQTKRSVITTEIHKLLTMWGWTLHPSIGCQRRRRFETDRSVHFRVAFETPQIRKTNLWRVCVALALVHFCTGCDLGHCFLLRVGYVEMVEMIVQ